MGASLVRFVTPGSYANDPPDPAKSSGSPAQSADKLAYAVELWASDDHVETVLGSLLLPSLAWASYYAAIAAYPTRKITLRLNSKLLANSAFPK